MATKTDFSAEEWSLLREAPQVVALGVTLAGVSGLFGTIKEAMTTYQSMVEGASSGNALIQALCTREEIVAAQEAIRGGLQEKEFSRLKDQVETQAVEKARAAVTLLGAKGSPVDQAAYRAFLNSVADSVAQASKEGTFLGFGGQRVSQGESSMLKRLADAIGD
jgi:hypothetical protein